MTELPHHGVLTCPLLVSGAIRRGLICMPHFFRGRQGDASFLKRKSFYESKDDKLKISTSHRNKWQTTIKSPVEVASGCILDICLSGNLSCLTIARQTYFSPLQVVTKLKTLVLPVCLSFLCLVWQVLSARKSGKAMMCVTGPSIQPSSEGRSHLPSAQHGCGEGEEKGQCFWWLVPIRLTQQTGSQPLRWQQATETVCRTEL